MLPSKWSTCFQTFCMFFVVVVVLKNFFSLLKSFISLPVCILLLLLLFCCPAICRLFLQIAGQQNNSNKMKKSNYTQTTHIQEQKIEKDQVNNLSHNHIHNSQEKDTEHNMYLIYQTYNSNCHTLFKLHWLSTKLHNFSCFWHTYGHETRSKSSNTAWISCRP